ncbi:peroxide stress protein YaaA [Candidatus Peregrinibacteria bacterium]|nr:peroxide stress protein YaaA [Candidatus Peregrinibacteria bacterium]
MIFLTNSAKTFNKTDDYFDFQMSEPKFLKESQLILEELQKKNENELKKIYQSSEKIALENFKRFKDWQKLNFEPAMLAYDGDIYKKLKSNLNLNLQKKSFAQQHMRIVSGLYGLIKPFDGIKRYRLEMISKLEVANKKNLYEFWKAKVTKHLNKEIAQQNEKILLNLCSDEYISVIDRNKLNYPIVDVVFKQKTEKGLKNVPIYSKQARGLMCSFLINNKIDNLEKVKLFDYENYKFEKKLSDEHLMIFIR